MIALGPLQTRPQFRIADLLQRFGGRFEGDANLLVDGFATLQNAAPHQLSFLTNPKYKAQLSSTQAAAILISPKDAALAQNGDLASLSLWIVPNPYALFAHISQFFADANTPPAIPGIHPSAVVDPTAQIDPDCIVEAQAVIGAHARIAAKVVVGAGCVIGANVSIGSASLLHPRVTVYADSVIGARCIVHAGAVIGADGFGFAKEEEAWIKIPQTGRVLIGDDVEIGANTTIDRGALDDTIIGNGVKLDNQIQIAHNVVIGEHTAMAGCVAVAGSSVIGKRCSIAGAARIVGHVELADDVHISATTLVTHSIAKAGQYTGAYPWSDHESWQKNAAALRHLHALRQRVRALESKSETPDPEPTFINQDNA